MHADAIAPGARVVVLDDVLATGGTARAKIELVERLGGVVVGALFVIELSFLNGRERIAGNDVHALIDYSLIPSVEGFAPSSRRIRHAARVLFRAVRSIGYH